MQPYMPDLMRNFFTIDEREEYINNPYYQLKATQVEVEWAWVNILIMLLRGNENE